MTLPSMSVHQAPHTAPESSTMNWLHVVEKCTSAEAWMISMILSFSGIWSGRKQMTSEYMG